MPKINLSYLPPSVRVKLLITVCLEIPCTVVSQRSLGAILCSKNHILVHCGRVEHAKRILPIMHSYGAEMVPML